MRSYDIFAPRSPGSRGVHNFLLKRFVRIERVSMFLIWFAAVQDNIGASKSAKSINSNPVAFPKDHLAESIPLKLPSAKREFQEQLRDPVHDESFPGG